MPAAHVGIFLHRPQLLQTARKGLGCIKQVGEVELLGELRRTQQTHEVCVVGHRERFPPALDLEQDGRLGSRSVSTEQTERVIHFKFGIPLIVTVQLDRFASEEHKSNAGSNSGFRNHYIGKLGA